MALIINTQMQNESALSIISSTSSVLDTFTSYILKFWGQNNNLTQIIVELVTK